MVNFYSFNLSVKGYSHITKNIVCQDASKIYENDNYKIAVVSDGHGDPSCFRSDIGSKLAVEISIESLKIFAEQIITTMDDNESLLYNDLLIEKYRIKIIKQLTDSIISKWYNAIELDIKEKPITNEELNKSITYAASYKKGEKLPHIYGATLIIALWVKDLLILIQQGDGSCTVFLEDGEIIQPIPIDENCHANITTSLCDDNAEFSIRHCVLNLKNRNAIACFLGSDGVEDSYPDITGNNVFYKELMSKYYNEYFEDNKKFNAYIKDYLPDFSRKGSADDISVAGIFDITKMKSIVSSFDNDIFNYNNEQKYNIYNQKIISMTRKHSILKENELNERTQLESLTKQLKDNQNKINELKATTSKFISNSDNLDSENDKWIKKRNELQTQIKNIYSLLKTNKIDITSAKFEQDSIIKQIDNLQNPENQITIDL